MNDPRKGLPSASGYERIHHCPASWQLSQQLYDKDDDTRDSESGTVTHALLSGDTPAREPTQAEKDRAEKCEEITQRLLAEWAGDEEVVGACEQRLWLHAGLKPCFSGQLDRLYTIEYNPGRTLHLIIDYKTLYGDHSEAPDNWQIKAQAALVFEKYPGAECVTAYIVQPEVSLKPEPAIFNREDLIRIRGQLAMDLNAIQDESPAFKAGKWCEFCRASIICPLKRFALERVQSVTVDADAWALMPAENRVRLYDACEKVDGFIKDVKARIKEDVVAGNTFDGQFKLKPGRKTQHITDVAKAYEIMAGVLTVEQFNAACSVSRPSLVDAVRESQALPKKEAEATVDTMLSAIIETKVSAPSLERVKP